MSKERAREVAPPKEEHLVFRISGQVPNVMQLLEEAQKLKLRFRGAILFGNNVIDGSFTLTGTSEEALNARKQLLPLTEKGKCHLTIPKQEEAA